jgi:NADH-quinone oxidoreductase subunit C
MNNSLKQEIKSMFKNIKVIISKDKSMLINARKDQLLAVLKFLKGKGYNHLALISCIDWEEEKQFEMVYVLTPYLQRSKKVTDDWRLHVIVKFRIPRENAEFITAIPVFKNAEPYEREIHELFGINFEGHPRLTQLFLEREYKIPPFRKDFDTRKYVKEIFDNIPFIPEKK